MSDHGGDHGGGHGGGDHGGGGHAAVAAVFGAFTGGGGLVPSMIAIAITMAVLSWMFNFSFGQMVKGAIEWGVVGIGILFTLMIVYVIYTCTKLWRGAVIVHTENRVPEKYWNEKEKREKEKKKAEKKDHHDHHGGHGDHKDHSHHDEHAHHSLYEDNWWKIDEDSDGKPPGVMKPKKAKSH